MADPAKPRPQSTHSATSSLMQDVPGAFPATPQFGADDDDHDEEEQAPQTLHQIVFARRAEYVRSKQIRIKVGTWNVAAFKGAEKDVGGWFVGGRGVAERLTGLDINGAAQEADATREDVGSQEANYRRKQSTLPRGDHAALPQHDQVDLYVLGLQEVVDVGSATEAFRPYSDPTVGKRWKEAMTAELPTGYTLVADTQLIGLLLLIFAHPDVAKDVKSVSTTSVGTGLMGYMGNKGAVTARIVLGETTRLVFVNCHLAAGSDKTALERRNWDAQQIVSRTRFEPIQDAMDLNQTTGEQIGDEDIAFWCGDLNYRLADIPGDDVRRLLMLHTRNEYDLSQPSAQKINKELAESTNSIGADGPPDSTSQPSLDGRSSIDNDMPKTLMHDVEASEDPTSLQATLSSLLPHDELRHQMKSRKAFHDGWREGPITFLPTYKYDAGTVGVFDSSEKKRAPSWCDRILYRTRRDKLAYEATVRDEEDARRKDEEMRATGIDQAASDEDVLYSYDPDVDGTGANDYDEYDEYDENEDGVIITKEGFEDEISLEYYAAHQRVLSSDHKPLDACFILKYDAVVPDLKMQVHAEVARELDKAENEGRPNVVVVVDRHNETPGSSDDGAPGKFEGVWFGDVRWMQTKHRSLTIANTSRVPATFSFIERPIDGSEQGGLGPKWLTIKINGSEIKSLSEKSGSISLEPGETCGVELELRISIMDDVRGLNEKTRELEDILLLRVDNGRDHFIPIRGHWLESSLGRSINKLVRIPEGGIRKLQGQKPDAKGKVKTAIDTIGVASSLSGNLSRSTSRRTEDSNAIQRVLSNDSKGADDGPVRFSAPRELFRLTEAVEDLGTRVIAEWEMMNAPVTPVDSSEATPHQAAPWDDHPAWPFDEECWTERKYSYWETALSSACDALDSDIPLDPSLPPDFPRIQRLYALCSILMTFLNSMPDGIITPDLWSQLESHLLENEKAKRKIPNDDLRTSLQEILSQDPSHSISFILITSMLERMLQERVLSASSHSALPSATHSRTNSREFNTVVEPPLSPVKKAGGAFKRIVGGKGPSSQAPTQPQPASKALAKIFSPAIIRGSPVAGNEKARGVAEKRKEDFLEIFLTRDEV